MIREIENFMHKLSYDGFEDGMYNFCFEYNPLSIISCFDKFKNINFYLDELIHFNATDLLNEIDAVSDKNMSLYRTKDNFSIYYSIEIKNNTKYIIIISAGEKQPGRYQVYSEGLWEIY